MVKLDVAQLKFMEDEDFRVLTALEMALRNHDVAPTVLIERIAGLPHGGARRRLNNMLKQKLIHHESMMYDGFAMKYHAYDFLALRTFSKRGTVLGVGCRVGCGKESDIFIVQDENGNDAIMKLQRLGRCSFRSVARNRDYKGNFKKRRGASWFYLSRLAAQKEFAFMKLLHDEGFPVPRPIDQNRHAIIMEHVNATLLNHIEALEDAQKVYERCLALIVRLAKAGLVHGDFNEFNLFVNNDMHIIMIDFPQMVSIDHPNASELFDRDVNNLALFFERRFGLKTQYFPKLENDVERDGSLDRTAIASGAISKAMLKEMDALRRENDEEAEEEEEEEEEEDEQEQEEDKSEEQTKTKNDNADDDDDQDQKPVSKAQMIQKINEQQQNNNNQTKENQSSSATTGTVGVTSTRGPQKFMSLSHLAKGEDFEKLVSQFPTAAATTTTGANGETVATKKQGSGKQAQKQAELEEKIRAKKEAQALKRKQEEQQQNGDDNEEQEEEEDDDEEESDNDNDSLNGEKRPIGAASIATTVAPTMLSKDVIRDRVKRQLQRVDDGNFKRNMHRNCQKGKEKISIKRQMKSHSMNDASSFW